MLSGSRTVGRSDESDPSDDDTTYWCLIGTIGMSTPTRRPTCPAAAPVALTTTSAAIEPRVVVTPCDPAGRLDRR